MSSDLGTGVSGLGTLTSSFYLGVGLMQIPGGILAAVWGPKRTVTLGVFISSLAVLATSISTSLIEAGLFRFVVGTGMALVFSPMVVLAARLLGGRSGVGAGLINSAFGLGGMLGLFGWILIATATGWRPSLVLSGSLGVISGLMTIVLVPRDERSDGFRLSATKLTAVIKQRNLALLGLGALGSNLGSVLISSFMVYYLQTSLRESSALAGLITGMVVFLPILTSLWGGQIYDRVKKPRRILVASGFGMVAALMICSIPALWAACLGAIIGGASVGPASTVAFAAARDLSKVEREYESLTIGWVNCISLTGSVWPPLVFSYLAESFGYTVAWLGGSGLSFILLIPLMSLARLTVHSDRKMP